MRSVVLRSLVVIGIGGIVLAGVLYVASTVDARPPTVVSIAVTQPIAGEPDQALITTSIEVTFSEPVVADEATDAIELDPPVEGTASLSGSSLIFTPNDPLALATAYAVTVTSALRDLAGNEISELPTPFTFETAGRPTVVETEPVDGAADVPVDAPISLRFSTLMDTASVEAGLRLRPAFRHDLRWSGELLEIVPTEPLQADREYELIVESEAADIAGVTIGEPISIGFRTVAPGLRAETLVPADGVDGVATGTSIAVIFDRPIDPDTVEGDLLGISPAVGGSLDVLPHPDDGSARILRFSPAGPLPPNTTFEVELVPGVVADSGGGLAEPVTWSFTTGAPAATVSNQVTFLTDRAGITNVWVMNPDGTGQRQVSSELSPVVDYVVAPDGSSLVVADGRRLVFMRADGTERQVLTDDEHWEFDPAFAPDGQHVAFGRADAATGAGLGLWTWDVGGGGAEPIELPADLRSSPSPSPSDGGPEAVLRAPRYAPDGLGLAFVDAAGAIGLLELPAQRLTWVPFDASAPPRWLRDSGAVLLTGREDGETDASLLEAPVLPLAPRSGDSAFRLGRSATSVSETAFGRGARVLAIATDGTIAYTDGRGALHVTTDPAVAGTAPVIAGERVSAAGFAPGEAAMVIVVGEPGRIEQITLGSGTRSILVREGSMPRWQP
jgi:hypothetical protein